MPAEATIEIMGELHTIYAPSKPGLIGGIGHLADSAAAFIKNLGVHKPINYIVDVGAGIGATALLFHSAFPEARILAIEPMKDNYDYLTRNTTGFPQIAPLKMVAYDKRCEVRVSMPTQEQRPDLKQGFGNSGLYSVYGQDTEHSEIVAADTLDNIVDGKVDLLKIDVEGAELLVLAGAERIASEDRPIILVEFRPANLKMAGTTGDDVRGLIKKTGYKIVGQYLSDVVLFPIEIESPNEDI
jgi:FkbM family methyltransferase